LNFISNPVYVKSSSVNWSSLESIYYIYKNMLYFNRLGNYWKEYTGLDDDRNGIIDQPYDTGYGTDYYPLADFPWNYKIVPEDTTSQKPGVTVLGNATVTQGATVPEDRGLAVLVLVGLVLALMLISLLLVIMRRKYS